MTDSGTSSLYISNGESTIKIGLALVRLVHQFRIQRITNCSLLMTLGMFEHEECKIAKENVATAMPQERKLILARRRDNEK